MKKVLIVDDEFEIVELLKIYFKNSGFEVLEAYDGQTALKMSQKFSIDIMIIDIMMPKMDGIELVKEIRKHLNVPIMFLSAKGEDMDKIYGLGIGADDYMSKPFNPLEVVARAQALIRRCYEFNKNNESINNESINNKCNIKIDNININQHSCEVFKNDIKINMTSMEYKLLLLMVKNSNRVLTKQQLYENVWDEEYLGNNNIIMVYISKLRDKIEENPKKPKYLKTIRGLGYRFERKH
ncbi:response regulator transcription factor [Haloimpatiens sp. FM7330]|uniref:response regulator transcription factor n=1 Tax=Haloimpatiens sp. FM7330 TaxID=3298610 RepID=UPI00363E75DC